jgi:hypothetical protein
VPFTQPLMTAMTTWERRPGFILLNERRQPWTRRNLSHAWGYERDTNPLLAPLKEAGQCSMDCAGPHV